MQNKNNTITKEDLGNMLHKYINPLYEKMDKFEGELSEVKHRMENELGEVKTIQLRMEHKLDENIKILYDQGDAHGKKLKDHEKRITALEKSI